MGEGEVQQVFYQTGGGGAMTGGSGRSSMGVSNGGGVSPLLLVTPYQERSRQFGEICEPSSSSRVCEEGMKGKDKDDGGGVGLLLGEEDEHESDVRRGGGGGLSGRVGLGISSRSEEEGESTTTTITTTSPPPPPSPPPPLKPMVPGEEERLPGTVVPDDNEEGGGDRFPSINDERDTHARIGEQSGLVDKDSFEGELTRKGEAEEGEERRVGVVSSSLNGRKREDMTSEGVSCVEKRNVSVDVDEKCVVNGSVDVGDGGGGGGGGDDDDEAVNYQR